MTLVQALDLFEKEQKVKEVAEFLWPKLCDFWNVEYKDKMPEIKLGKSNYFYFCPSSDECEVCISVKSIGSGISYGEELTHALRNLVFSNLEYDDGVDEWFGALGRQVAYLVVQGTEFEYLLKKRPKMDHWKIKPGKLKKIKRKLKKMNDQWIFLETEINRDPKRTRTDSRKLMAKTWKLFFKIRYVNENLPHKEGYGNAVGILVEDVLKKDPDIIRKPDGYIRKKYFKC